MSLSCLLHLPCTSPDSQYQSCPRVLLNALGTPGRCPLHITQASGSSRDTYCISPRSWNPWGYPLHVSQVLRILWGYSLHVSQALGNPLGILAAHQLGPGIPMATHCMSSRLWDPWAYPLHISQTLGSPGLPTACHSGSGIPGDAHCTSARLLLYLLHRLFPVL